MTAAWILLTALLNPWVPQAKARVEVNTERVSPRSREKREWQEDIDIRSSHDPPVVLSGDVITLTCWRQSGAALRRVKWSSMQLRHGMQMVDRVIWDGNSSRGLWAGTSHFSDSENYTYAGSPQHCASSCRQHMVKIKANPWDDGMLQCSDRDGKGRIRVVVASRPESVHVEYNGTQYRNGSTMFLSSGDYVVFSCVATNAKPQPVLIVTGIPDDDIASTFTVTKPASEKCFMPGWLPPSNHAACDTWGAVTTEQRVEFVYREKSTEIHCEAITGVPHPYSTIVARQRITIRIKATAGGARTEANDGAGMDSYSILLIAVAVLAVLICLIGATCIWLICYRRSPKNSAQRRKNASGSVCPSTSNDEKRTSNRPDIAVSHDRSNANLAPTILTRQNPQDVEEYRNSSMSVYTISSYCTSNVEMSLSTSEKQKQHGKLQYSNNHDVLTNQSPVNAAFVNMKRSQVSVVKSQMTADTLPEPKAMIQRIVTNPAKSCKMQSPEVIELEDTNSAELNGITSNVKFVTRKTKT